MNFDKMLESEEEGEMRFNCNIRDKKNKFNADKFIKKIDEEIMANIEKNCRDITYQIGISFENDFDITRFMKEETELKSNITKDEYNKLVYCGEEYYVKKKNTVFPICVMNGDLIQVGIIKEDDINNIMFC